MINYREWISQGKIASIFQFYENYYARVVAAIGATYLKAVDFDANDSLTDAVDISGFSKVAIEMPLDWDTANLTFQASSSESGPFRNVYLSNGSELVVTASEDRMITDIPELAPLRWIKVRSGTNAASVNQTAARRLTLVLKG